ncbi:hypothetical protein F2Q69_00006576 [Brassica cretica]|uniref:Uncharacterized protein n=1 Tax=Brassica cretica TaxID=69181 RepID=A0A8S9P458_BRACR|nr:hypothetical protein F2Q69_00006576 [Brassica cretica]
MHSWNARSTKKRYLQRSTTTSVRRLTLLSKRRPPNPSTDSCTLPTIDTSVQTSIDIRPRDMVVTLILERDENGDLHDQEGHPAIRGLGIRVDTETPMGMDRGDDFWQVVKEEKLQKGDFDVESSMSFGGSHWCRPKPRDEHRSMVWEENRSASDIQHRSTESVASCEMVKIMTHDEFAARHPHPPKPLHVDIDQQSEQVTDRHRDSTSDRQSTSVIDRRAPLCYRVQLPKIDLGRLNALRNQSQPSETPIDNISEQSEDARANASISGYCGKNLEEEEGKGYGCSSEGPRKLKRTLGECSTSVFCDTGYSVSILPKVMADHLDMKIEPSENSFTFVDCSQRNSRGFIRNLEVQIGNALVLVDFHVLDIKLSWNSSLPLGIALMATVGALCDIHTNKLCLTLIDPTVYYDSVRVVKQQTSYMEIGDNPGFIAACHSDHEADEESKFEASIATQP